MTIAELKAEKATLKRNNQSLRDSAEAEKRALTDVELDTINTNIRRISAINEEIADQAAEMRATTKRPVASKVSIRSKIAEALEKRERMVRVSVVPEQRNADINVTGETGEGKETVSNDVLDIVGPLKQRMLLGKAGATYMTGLKGNVTIPVYTGGQAGWAAEGASAVNGKGSFKGVTMTPKRLTAVVEVSRQFLLQNTGNADTVIENDLITKIGEKLESAILGNGAGSATEPKGLFKGVSPATKLEWGTVVDLEAEVDDAMALGDNCSYLMNTKAWGLAKKTVKADGQGGFLIDPGKTMNDYRADRSTSVYKSGTDYGVAFGDFSKLVIGQWGNIELTIDEITKADQDIVRIIVNSYWDYCVSQEKAIKCALVNAGE